MSARRPALLPAPIVLCPFCGCSPTKDKAPRIIEHAGGLFCVTCYGCLASGPLEISAEKAAESWRTRKPSTPDLEAESLHSDLPSGFRFLAVGETPKVGDFQRFPSARRCWWRVNYLAPAQKTAPLATQEAAEVFARRMTPAQLIAEHSTHCPSCAGNGIGPRETITGKDGDWLATWKCPACSGTGRKGGKGNA